MPAAAVERAAPRAVNPRPVSPPPARQEVSDRWPWLLERLALHVIVRQLGPGDVAVEEKDGSSFTTVVTPEEWARIATPLESDADDPQDFGWHQPDETYLVFFEDELDWSIRPELPPVRGGAESRRRFRAAAARGASGIGWLAHRPPDGPRGRRDP